MWAPLRLLAISFLSLKGRHEYKAKGNGYGAIETFLSCRAPCSLKASRQESQDLDTILRLQLEERKKDAMKPSRKKYLQEKLGMDKNEIDRLVRMNPYVLEYHSEENMGPTIDLLQNRLKLDQKGVKKIVLSQNRLLGSSIATLDSNISWLQKRFNIADDQIGKLVCKNTVLLVASIENALEPNIKFLQTQLDDKTLKKLVFQQPYIGATRLGENVSWLQERLDLNTSKALGKFLSGAYGALNVNVTNLEAKISWFEEGLCLPPDKVAKLFFRFPNLLGQRPTGLSSKKEWLQQRLQLSDEEVGKMLFKSPNLLAYNMEDTIEPKLGWLQSRLGLDDAGVRKIICRLPSLLVVDMDATIGPRVGLLQSRLGLDDAGVRKMVCWQPSLLVSDMDATIEPKLSWFQSRLGLDDAGLRKAVCGQPSIMCMSTENNLAPKIDFVAGVLGEEQARTMISKNLSILTRSLEKRIKPRVAEALELGMLLDVKSLGTITGYTSDEWEDRKYRVRLKLDW